MGWFKKYVLPHLFSKNWQIRVHQKATWACVEVTNHVSSVWANPGELYLDLIERVVGGYQWVAVSQRIDRGQWEVGNCELFADKIRQDFSIKAQLTTGYGKPHLPDADDRDFVIHTIAPFKRAAWQASVRFGMFSLANIAYGLERLPDDWPNTILEWNQKTVSWFELEVSDEEFGKLLNQVGLVLLTIDSHLCFCTGNSLEVTELVRVINDVGAKHSLVTVIEPAPSSTG